MEKSKLTDILRAWPWLAFALLTTAIVALVAPQQVGVLAWAATKLAWGAYLGYWIDRSVFHYARPHVAEWVADNEIDRDAARHWRLIGSTHACRRAVIIAAAIIALGLGV